MEHFLVFRFDRDSSADFKHAVRYLIQKNFAYNEFCTDEKGFIRDVPLTKAIAKIIANKGGVIAFKFKKKDFWLRWYHRYPKATDGIEIETFTLPKTKSEEALMLKLSAELFELLKSLYLCSGIEMEYFSGWFDGFLAGENPFKAEWVNWLHIFGPQIVKSYPDLLRTPALRTKRLRDGSVLIQVDSFVEPQSPARWRETREYLAKVFSKPKM